MNETSPQPQPPPPLKPFLNPYPTEGNYDPLIHSRLCADMPKAPYQFLQSINPQRGSMQTTVNLLIEKLITSLKQHGITDITRIEDAKIFIANCTVNFDSAGAVNAITRTNVPQQPANSTLPQASAPNDGLGTSGTPVKNKKPTPKSTGVAGGVKGRSGAGNRVIKQG